jgi:hypothetical protein
LVWGRSLTAVSCQLWFCIVAAALQRAAQHRLEAQHRRVGRHLEVGALSRVLATEAADLLFVTAVVAEASSRPAAGCQRA